MYITSNFAERLKEYMEEQKIKAPALAKAIGVNRTTVSELLRGKYLPSTSTFVAICEYFNCSADYILGLDDFPKRNKFAHAIPFAVTLRKCLKNAKKSQYRLQKDKNISRSQTYGWLYGKTIPTMDSIIILAEYLDCSVDELLGRTD